LVTSETSVGDSHLPCPICAHEATLRFSGHPTFKKSEKRFDIYHCSECATAFASPQEVDEDIYELIYRDGEQVPGYGRYWRYQAAALKMSAPLAYLTEVEEGYWAVARVLQAEQARVSRPLRVLEVGSGLGYLTYSLSRHGFDATGIDISAHAVTLARRAFGDRYENCDLDSFRLRGEPFDVVIAVELIEHLADPIAFIQRARTLVRDEGLTILTTPNRSDSPESVLWFTTCPPVHLWWFSEESFTFLARRLALALPEIVDYSSYYDGCFILQSREDPPLPYHPTGEPTYDESGHLIRKYETEGRAKSVSREVARRLGLLRALRRARRVLPSTRPIRSGARGRTCCAVFRGTLT